MKILFISDVSLEQPASGSEQVLFHQTNGLAGSGVAVWAVTRRIDAECGGPTENLGGLSVIHYHNYSNRLPGFIAVMIRLISDRLSKIFATERFDAIVAHQPLVFSFLCWLRSIRKLPLVYIFHSPWHEEYLLNNERRSNAVLLIPTIIRKHIERYCVKRADQVIVLSEYMKHRVMRTHAVKAENIVVNPGGADTQRFKWAPNREKLKSQLGFPPNKVHLLTVRNLEQRMGLDRLIRGMTRIKKAYPQTYLIIGGNGSERQRLEDLVRQRGLEQDVRLTGFIPPERLPDYYAAADFFVMPTRRLEGFGLVTVESLSCGTPVLGTPVGGTPEILKPLSPDFIFQDNTPQALADGIIYNIQNYFEDKDVYVALRGRCRSYAVDKYSWDRHIRLLTEVLHRCSGAEQASISNADHFEHQGNH